MIDVHTHCHLPEHWGTEWNTHWQRAFGGSEWPTVTAADYDLAMAEAQVDTAFVFGLRATRAGVATPNEHVATFCATVKTKTVGFMALDLNDADVMEQLHDGVGHGLRGVKLYPVLAHFDPAERKHRSFYKTAQELGLILLWHMGGTASAAGRLALSHPLVLDEIAYQFPGLTQIVAHMGTPWYRDTIALLRKAPRVFADVSGLWSRPRDAYAALATAVEWGVVEKLLFGSDYPSYTPSTAISNLEDIVHRPYKNLPALDPLIISHLKSNDLVRLLLP